MTVQGGSFHFTAGRLSESPVRVRINLNQWIRFDRLGDDHVSVISSRASPLVRVKSNDISISILAPDPAALHERFAWDREHASDEDAVRDPANLGTEEAALELARHAGDDIRLLRMYESGIVRSPFRAAAVREMERLPADPDFSVSTMFLTALSDVSVDPVDHLGTLVHHAPANRVALLHRLSAALSNKRGAARELGRCDGALREALKSGTIWRLRHMGSFMLPWRL